MCAVLVESADMRVLLVNVYMLADTKHDLNNLLLFNDVLAVIAALSREHNCDFFHIWW